MKWNKYLTDDDVRFDDRLYWHYVVRVREMEMAHNHNRVRSLCNWYFENSFFARNMPKKPHEVGEDLHVFMNGDVDHSSHTSAR